MEQEKEQDALMGIVIFVGMIIEVKVIKKLN